MKIFGYELSAELTFVIILILILCAAAFMHGLTMTYTETFTDGDQCQIIGSYTIEKCGTEIKVNMDIKGDKTPPKPEPKPEPKETESIECPFPLESRANGCQLKCPTSTFLMGHPTILCQKVLSGRIRKMVDDKCPDGYKMDPAGCVEILTSCPANFDLIDGSCQEKCPEGSTSQFAEVEIDNNGFVEKRSTRICQSTPLISS